MLSVMDSPSLCDGQNIPRSVARNERVFLPGSVAFIEMLTFQRLL